MEAAGIREPGAMRFIPDAIEALIALDRPADAEVLLKRLEHRARRLERTSALAAAGRCRGLLHAARGDLAGAVSALEAAAAEDERSAIPFERARTLAALGQVRRRARQRRLARDALTAALRIFQELGAELSVSTMRAELARIGGRAPSSGELTPTERRVTELVAEGRTTKDVAAQLFVSIKTVEGHLSHIYSKLGIRSRAQLAARFAAHRGDSTRS
jgi:DNA-binding CsgD family transcriptional regulator